MRFVSFDADGHLSYGLLSDGRILDLGTATPAGSMLPPTLLAMVAAGDAALSTARTLLDQASDDQFRNVDTLTLLAPIPRPSKNIFCVGRNYHDHVAEGFRAAGRDVVIPVFPQFFTKAPTTVIGPDAGFEADRSISEKFDYEVELALVIGNGGRDIAREDAMRHVFGVTILNDITARDLQRRHDQWFKGKSLDGSAPMGPCIVTLDEIRDLDALELVTRVNGEERQRAHVAQMMFDIPEIIAQLSLGMTLEPGDIIATGTPSGVGYAMDPPRFLIPGDVVECSIEGIGTLVTHIVSPGGGQ